MATNVPPVVQPLVVGLAPSYVLTTGFIPGVPPDPPAYIMSTPVIPGIPLEETAPSYTLATPVIPGVELPLDAGPDDLDETYLRTTRSPPSILDHQDETYLRTTRTGPDFGPWHLDETYEPTTFTVFGSDTVLVSAITFFPVRRKSTVQKLTTVLNPGADQTVRFPLVRA